ncbi:MAG TPA: ATP-dependent DNA helicase [Candidatus Saccharimonadales bacterium]|nr:ATP-dependent DNA helicase [Candidatus Saccharimonadales bacterium]
MDLSDLNPEQRAAVEHDTGPMLVVAGAGTGKTEVITRRVAYLISAGQAQPGEILVLTFTEKAAREMAERIYDLVGWRAFQIPVMTFHGFGAELLGNYAHHIGRSTKGGLINDTQKTLLLLQHLNRVALSYYPLQTDLYEFLAGVVAYIGQLQNNDVSAASYQSYVQALQSDPAGMHPQDVAEQADLAALYSLYETLKNETGSFDYSDQLILPLEILRQRPNLAERLHQRYRYVLVDEYQDTNLVQDQLLRSFVPADGNIFAVGDDDQSIYAFRGSEVANILSFSEHFKLSRPVVLVRNYRSGQVVLDAAYRLIRHNDPERLEARLGLDKRLIAAARQDGEVKLELYPSRADELEAVATALKNRFSAGEPAASMAVLAATKAPLKDLSRLLRQRGVPFALVAESNIFEQPELINLWYLLRWLDHRATDESIAHVMLGPFMGWQADVYRRLLERSRADLATPEDTLRTLAATDPAIAVAVKRLDEWRGWAREMPVSRLVFQLVFETGLSERLIAAAEHNPRIVRVFEDLQRLLAQMQDFEMVAVDASLSSYLAVFPSPPVIEVTEPVGDSQGVQLLTVHASKGLEFETVYLIGCTQRSWSEAQRRGHDLPEGLRRQSELPPEHEFRRLMYVAVTRAKQRLIASAAIKDGSGRRQTLSPFLGELLGREVWEVPAAGVISDTKKMLSNLQRFYPLDHQQQPRFVFESSDGWLELGVNDLGLYERCPYDFYLQKVLGISQPFGPQLGFGLALHGTIQSYYEARLRGEVLSLAILHARLDELWSDRGYERREIAQTARQQAHEVVERFVMRDQAAGRQVLASEMPIRMELPEAKLRLRGRIDAAFETAHGLELRDFKTGRKTDPDKLKDDAKKNFQLRSYALAYQAMTGQAPAMVILDYVVTGVEGAAELSEAILKNHRAKLAKLAAGIRQRDFRPKPSPFHDCAAIRYYGTATADELEPVDA